MHRHTPSDTLDAAAMSGRSSRAHSVSSDRWSVASSVTVHMPTTVRPAPAYIAASVASQIVTDAHNAQLRDEDPDCPELANAVFAEPALTLLNAFLDHLLFAFLSAARSPALSAIRPAIADVLKPRLAREAMDAADEELEGLLAADDDDEANGADPTLPDTDHADHWDVEKVWKRTRLRIMVYTRLGELEDDDEERYVQQERGLSMDADDADDAGLVSWAAAIFLTSVVEYVAEQALLVSGAAAHARVAARLRKLSQQADADPHPVAVPAIDRLVIEEPDAEKIALNAALGRLWRTWRKRVRSPLSPLSPGRGVRSISSSSSLHRPRLHRNASDELVPQDADVATPVIPEHPPTETEIASNIPLPQGDNDVNEIEIPGLADTFEDSPEQPVPSRLRPLSVVIPASVWSHDTAWNKGRPNSLPVRPVPHFLLPLPTSPVASTPSEPASPSENGDDLPFETPMERIEDPGSYMEDTDHEDMHQHREAARRQLESPTSASRVAVATAAAAAGISSRISSGRPGQTRDMDQSAELDRGVSTIDGDESEPKVLHSKSLSGAESVRSFSKPSFSPPPPSQEMPFADPNHMLYREESAASSSSHGPPVDKESEIDPTVVGIARTSDLPTRSTSTPDLEHPDGREETPGQVAPRRELAPTSIPPQSVAISDALPAIQERAVTPVDLPTVQPVQTKRHSLSGNSLASGSVHSVRTVSPLHGKQEAPASVPRNRPMPIVQDVEGTKVKVATPHRSPPLRSSSSIYNPKRSPPRSAESLVTGAGQRTSMSDSPRSQAISHDRSLSDKASLKRVVSSSSSTTAKRSNGATAIPSGRESTASHRSRNLSGRMSEEDREREFDSLVKGKDTVKFTLTPENMRALDDTPVHKAEPPKPSSAPANVTVYPRVNAEDSLFGTGNLPPKRTFSKSRGPGPTVAQHKQSPSRTVISKPMAREARIDTESMRDFADFIRSTGPPPGQDATVQPFVGKRGTAPNSAHGSTSLLGRKASTSEPGSRLDSASSRTRRNMEPRSPAGLSNGNDDLIDFIRQGPPNASTGQPRIPRNVAPFRTTVDSDQFDTMLGGHGNVETAFGSTTSTVDSKYSDTTVHSRTGLIPDPAVVQPAYSNTPQQLSGNMASNEPDVTRTRRRVKDPYAIDMSDDDDENDDNEDGDQLTALPPSSQPSQSGQASRQESLMDFLNGMDPPSNSKPQPFVLSEETIAAARARATSSSSATATRNGPLGSLASTTVSSDAPRAYKPRLQARTPAAIPAGRSTTSDLADFLRDSGPPEIAPGRNANANNNNAPSLLGGGAAKKEEEKKGFRFWKRGTKSEKTFGDMP